MITLKDLTHAEYTVKISKTRLDRAVDTAVVAEKLLKDLKKYKDQGKIKQSAFHSIKSTTTPHRDQLYKDIIHLKSELKTANNTLYSVKSQYQKQDRDIEKKALQSIIDLLSPEQLLILKNNSHKLREY